MLIWDKDHKVCKLLQNQTHSFWDMILWKVELQTVGVICYWPRGQPTPKKWKSANLIIIKYSRFRMILMCASCCGESFATQTPKDMMTLWVVHAVTQSFTFLWIRRFPKTDRRSFKSLRQGKCCHSRQSWKELDHRQWSRFQCCEVIEIQVIEILFKIHYL